MEIQKSIITASYTRHQLGQLWRETKTNTSSRRKTKRVYALETAPLTDGLKSNLKVYLFKDLRQSRDFKTTYGQVEDGESRSNTSKKPMEEVNKELNNKPQKKAEKEEKQG